MARRKRTAAESRQVERARKKFEAWRRSRSRISPIPDELWESAVVAAKEVGINRTSRALGLEYYALKKRVMASPGRPPMEASRFIEFESSAPPFFTEWAVEMDNGRGGCLRVAVRSPSGPDVVALSRTFWGKES
ncbi:MAG: hypothetical protein GY906_06315 [bacterium]|nr:hypothetical protein [bacterium]